MTIEKFSQIFLRRYIHQGDSRYMAAWWVKPAIRLEDFQIEVRNSAWSLFDYE